MLINGSHQVSNLLQQALLLMGVLYQEEEESMASFSGNENNQNMVDSAKAADVKIIPCENAFDGGLEVLRSQLRYVEPPYYGPGSDYIVEDPVSDTDDPNVMSNSNVVVIPVADETLSESGSTQSNLRLDSLIIEAIANLKERNGSNRTSIATYMRITIVRHQISEGSCQQS